MNILAVDPGSLTTGWCWLPHEGVIRSGEWTFEGHRAERALAYYLILQDAIQRHEPDVVILEEPNRFQGRGTVAIAGWVLVTEMVCEYLRVPYASVEPHVLKKHATGKGNAGKPQMQEAAREIVGRPVGEDEADAICAAMWGREHVTVSDPATTA